MGNVGSVLGKKWADKGHSIRYGVRDLQNPKMMKLKEYNVLNIHGRLVSEVADWSDVIILAVPWNSVEDTIKNLGNLSGKIIIDCINPIKKDLMGLDIGEYSSGAEKIADLTQGAKIVKAFNITGSGNMLNPNYGYQQADMFICGDYLESKTIVSDLVKEIGFNVVDSGPLSNASLLEHLALTWINLAIKQGFGTEIAFKLLKR